MASINGGESQRFAVYAGDGLYVSWHAIHGLQPSPFIRLGDAQAALSLPRSQAINVCHGARRAGVMAWLVPHQVGVAA
jgi:hypothetical protein